MLKSPIRKVTVAIAMLTALTLDGAAFGGRVTDTPVTSTIQGLGPDTSPTYRIQSDLLGSYKNSSALESIIQGIGDWELDMVNFTSSPQRTVLIDLRDPVPGTNPNNLPPPFEYAYVRARFISKCSQYGLNLRSMTFVGQQYQCELSVGAISYGGQKYALRMNPNTYGTDNVTWTCTNAPNGKCNQWRMEPSVYYTNAATGASEQKNRAQLVRVVTAKGQTTYEDRGEYYLSFIVDVTNP
ncbi:MAG: hypothetical protein ACR2HX_19130 [Pyrinomonadaceae bacterium]